MRVTLVATNEAGATDHDFLVEVDCAVSKGCGCASSELGPMLFGLAALLMLRRMRRT